MANRDQLFRRNLFWLAGHSDAFLKRYSKLLYPDSYENPEEAWLLEQCVTHYEKYKVPLPPEALQRLLDKKKDNSKFDKDTVVEFYETEAPDEELIPFLIDEADEYLRLRYSEVIAQEYVDTLGDGGTFEEVYEVLANGLTELSRSSDRSPSIMIGIDPLADFEAMSAMFELDGTEVASGIQAVDDVMQGGLRRGELGVYLAPPSHGKSQWLTFIGQQAWKANKVVLYISFEMSELRIAQRFYAGLVMEDSNRLTVLPPERFVSRWAKAQKLYGSEQPFIVNRFPDSGASANDVALIAKEHIADGRDIGLIVVDYADIMAPVKKTGDRKEDQANAYKELRNLAVELDLPIWTASQANRQALRRSVITIEHIADSFDKAKIADYIIAQCQTEEEKRVGEVRFFFAKCRYNGQGEQIRIDTDFSRSLFTQSESGISRAYEDEAAAA